MIFQRIQNHSYELEGLAQSNEVLTSYNPVVMAQLEQMTVTINAMQAQLKTLSSATTDPKSTKRKFYCWSCSINYTRGSKTCSAKNSGHKEDSYYNKRLDGNKNGCELQLGAIINKIEISNPKIILINYIGTPPNPPSKNMLKIAD